MQKLTGMEWLKKHISKLEITNSNFKDKIEKIKNIEPEIYNEFQPWTPLKLVLLNYVLDTCTIIIRKKSFFREKYYVDLFAGSSINRIKDSEDFLIGSPLISSLKYGNDFIKMFFCENNPEFFNSLKKRLASLNTENKVILDEDCNIYLNRIMEIVNKPNVYSFFFIDPYNNEFCWESMKKVLNVNKGEIVGRDILFTFMTSEIMRAVGLAKSGIGEGAKLTQFFGDESWKKISEEDYVNELVSLYENNIIKEVPEKVIRTIKVQSKKHGFCYHLFFITNKTKNDNPWLKSIDKAKKEIENNSDKSVEMALDIIKKRQTEISQFE